MKKALFLFASTLLVMTAHASGKVFDDLPRIISIDELSFEKIQEVIRSKNSDFTLELREGTVIPLKFLLKHQVFSAMIDPNLVFKVEKTCYLRAVNKKCYMSDDLVHWEKAGKFLDGKATIQVRPNETGFTLETNIVPHEQSESEE